MSWWSQVSETAAQGLQITVVGMALVFFTLGLVILAVVLLTRLPGLRVEEEKQAPKAPVAPPVEAAVAAPVQESVAQFGMAGQELAQVAAIALALVRSQQGRQQGRRVAQTTRTAWKSYGRAHQLGL